MKTSVVFLLALFLSSVCVAKEKTTVAGDCESAIKTAEVSAANHKWSSSRPDPTAFVLNISTSANFTKSVVLGAAFSHSKSGELTFTENTDGKNKTCTIQSNGHPADVIAKEFSK